MERTAMAWPVKPGATQEEIGSIAQMFKDRPDEYRESRKALGMSFERAYHQPTPMGDFILAYVESEAGAGPTIAQMVGSDHQLDKDFARMVNEVHGVDITAPPAGPPPETIGVWTDPDVRTRGKGLAFCAPGIPGTEEAGRAFTKEAFQTRRDEMTASRRALRQSVEVVTLQQTPQGPIICVYLEGEDPVDANRRFATSQEPFDLWFKDGLAKLFPPEIDFTKPVPPVKEIFDSQAN